MNEHFLSSSFVALKDILYMCACLINLLSSFWYCRDCFVKQELIKFWIKLIKWTSSLVYWLSNFLVVMQSTLHSLFIRNDSYLLMCSLFLCITQSSFIWILSICNGMHCWIFGIWSLSIAPKPVNFYLFIQCVCPKEKFFCYVNWTWGHNVVNSWILPGTKPLWIVLCLACISDNNSQKKV